jgi:RND family efflux transporter MFP subunit
MIRRSIKAILPIIILAIGAGSGFWLFSNPEEAQKRTNVAPQHLLVETGKAEFGTYRVNVETMGQVVPAIKTSLKSRVSGEIIKVSDEFIPGGNFRKGETILLIDPEDYMLTAKRQSAIAKQAKADYRLEMGRQSVARDELKILSSSTGVTLENEDLALRKPQLERAKAELEKAQSDLEGALLNIERTNIKAPFDAIVIERNAMLGNKISTQDQLATLVSTEEYWVDISMPIDRLQWLISPDNQNNTTSKATIIMDSGRSERSGHLLKIAGNLDEASRLANIIVSIPDPLNLKSSDDLSPVIIGDYVSVVIEGKELENTVRVPLSWLRENNLVYVAKQDSTLDMRSVEIIYEDREYAYISSGLKKGDRVIFSNIPVPVDGMKIRTMEEAKADVIKKIKSPKGIK